MNNINTGDLNFVFRRYSNMLIGTQSKQGETVPGKYQGSNDTITAMRTTN